MQNDGCRGHYTAYMCSFFVTLAQALGDRMHMLLYISLSVTNTMSHVDSLVTHGKQIRYFTTRSLIYRNFNWNLITVIITSVIEFEILCWFVVRRNTYESEV